MNRRQRLRRTRIRNACLIGPLALALVLWLIGLLLPIRHAEEVRTFLGASAETVWAVLNDLDGMPNWRHDIRGLERLPDLLGQARWLEVGSGGRRTTYQRIESVTPRRLVVRSSAPNRQWVYEIRALDRGSELAVREERTISHPLMRALVLIFGADRGRIEGLTSDLDRRLAGRRAQLAARPVD